MSQYYAAQHYAERALSYLNSSVHSNGEDLDLIQQLVVGKAYCHVLDLGCGGGHVSYRIAPHVAEVVACDVTEQMLHSINEEASKRHLVNIKTVLAPAEKLPFLDGEFDAVFCRFTTHHWSDAASAMHEVKRVLAPSGLAMFIDVTSPTSPLSSGWLQTLELLRDISHVRNYSITEWASLLGGSGFTISEIKTSRLRMEFESWIERAETPRERKEAIQSLLKFAPKEILSYYAVEEDGSFTLDTAYFISTWR